VRRLYTESASLPAKATLTPVGTRKLSITKFIRRCVFLYSVPQGVLDSSLFERRSHVVSRLLLVAARCSSLLTPSAGHTVTALVRNVALLSSIAAAGAILTVVKGQPQDGLDVDRVFNAVADDMPTVVIAALNNDRTSDNPFAKQISPPSFMLASHVNVIKAMKRHNTRRLVTL
jgi:hypothetical protein